MIGKHITITHENINSTSERISIQLQKGYQPIVHWAPRQKMAASLSEGNMYYGAVHKLCRLGKGGGRSPKDDLLLDLT